MKLCHSLEHGEAHVILSHIIHQAVEIAVEGDGPTSCSWLRKEVFCAIFTNPRPPGVITEIIDRA